MLSEEGSETSVDGLAGIGSDFEVVDECDDED